MEHPNPFELFAEWYDTAMSGGLVEPSAMALASVDTAGRPSVRVVLLKAFDADGFVFYTNYESRKGQQLAANPHASLVLWWDRLERQVHIEGVVQRLEPAQSDAYFASRSRGSQLSAAASRQSQPVESRAVLEQEVVRLEAQYANRPLPRPAQWGGYRLVPQRIEFWQGKPNRLHNRMLYCRSGDDWVTQYLSP